MLKQLLDYVRQLLFFSYSFYSNFVDFLHCAFMCCVCYAWCILFIIKDDDDDDDDEPLHHCIYNQIDWLSYGLTYHLKQNW